MKEQAKAHCSVCGAYADSGEFIQTLEESGYVTYCGDCMPPHVRAEIEAARVRERVDGLFRKL